MGPVTSLSLHTHTHIAVFLGVPYVCQTLPSMCVFNNTSVWQFLITSYGRTDMNMMLNLAYQSYVHTRHYGKNTC